MDSFLLLHANDVDRHSAGKMQSKFDNQGAAGRTSLIQSSSLFQKEALTYGL